ncbi:MAG: nuclear transport factor 2 family protein [Halioglobus sp.]
MKVIWSQRLIRTGVLLILITAGIGAKADSGEQQRIHQALDAFHQAAATGDFDAYLTLMTEDVVFLGTDGTERWQGAAFRDFAQPRFAQGGWRYVPQSRNINLNARGDVAWFDEALENDGLGKCRSSGLLLQQDGQWRIAQYNLSVPIPNALVDSVVEDIQAFSMAPADMAIEDAAVESETEGQNCSRNRHKTNRKAGC